MKSSTFFAVIIALLVIGGGWYWWMGQGYHAPIAPAPAITYTAGQVPEASSTQPLSTENYSYVPGNLLLGASASTTLGVYLIGSNGMTLYIYAKDATNTSACSGACTMVWAPYIITSANVLSNVQAGISGKAGFITRADGSLQATYNGKPLYYFTKDTASGETLGQDVGNVWSVVRP